MTTFEQLREGLWPELSQESQESTIANRLAVLEEEHPEEAQAITACMTDSQRDEVVRGITELLGSMQLDFDRGSNGPSTIQRLYRLQKRLRENNTTPTQSSQEA